MTHGNLNAKMALLTLQPPEGSLHQPKELRIPPGQTLTIGRAIGTPETTPHAKNAFYESKSMSRRHCIFFLGFAQGGRDMDQVFVQDLGTANGTWVNGARLGREGSASLPMAVFDGDKIGFAQTVEQDEVTYEGVDVVIGIELRDESDG